jgi:hypothetical protein
MAAWGRFGSGGGEAKREGLTLPNFRGDGRVCHGVKPYPFFEVGVGRCDLAGGEKGSGFTPWRKVEGCLIDGSYEKPNTDKTDSNENL